MARNRLSWMQVYLILILFTLLSSTLYAQELEPRAYVTLPVGMNFALASYTFAHGDVLFDPTLPVEDVIADIHSMVFGYARAINVFGRSSSIAFAIPYTIGNLSGKYIGEDTSIRRSGLRDPRFRFTMNLVGGPALSPKEYSQYQQKTNLGWSLVVIPPLGQYDPVKVINLSSNRWSFKTELGLSNAMGKWMFDVYGGVWFFTDNTEFQTSSVRSQAPIPTLQGHVSYTLRRGLWLAFDATAYWGGRTTVDGVSGQDFQKNSRVGATFSVPIKPGHSLKFSFATGAFTSVGSDFNAYTVAYQVAWF